MMEEEIKALDMQIIEQLKRELCNDDTVVILMPRVFSAKPLAYHSMILDLQSVIASLNTLIHRGSVPYDNFHDSTWLSVISSYTRCFTDASHNKLPKLDEKDVPKDELEAHKKLMYIRNNLSAHRGNSLHE